MRMGSLLVRSGLHGHFHIVPSMNSTPRGNKNHHGEVECGAAEIPLKGRLQSFDGGESFLFTLFLFSRRAEARETTCILVISYS